MATAKKLPSGSWRVQVYAGKDANGKPKYESIVKATQDEANFAALEYKLHHKAVGRDSSNMTLKEAIARYVQSKDGILSPSTILGYTRKSKNYMQGIMAVPLNKLTQELIQTEVNKMAKNKSSKTVRDMHGLLSAVLKAYRPNFTLRTTLPQKQNYVANIPNEKDIAKIIEITKGTEIELPVILAVWLGMRMSEIRGIKRSAIKGNKLYIKQALIDIEKGSVLKGTKSTAGTRAHELPPYIKGLIDAQPETGEYLISLSGQAIYKRFSRICEKHGLNHFRFHDLRHANASVMLALNVPDKYAMERGGWATNSTLKTVYQHTLSEQRKAVDTKVNDYFNSIITRNVTRIRKYKLSQRF